jgi:hypothetical protein
MAVRSGLVGGVGTEQVVKGVPAGDALSQHLGAAELTEHATARGFIHPGQAGSGARSEIVDGVQADQPEHPCSPWRSRMSLRSASAASRSASSVSRIAFSQGLCTPARVGPRHSPSAWRSRPAPRLSSEPSAACAARRRNRHRSSCSALAGV